MFGLIRGILRTFLFGMLVVNGALVVLLVGWLPVKIRGVSLGPWIVHGIAAIFTYALGVRVEISDRELWKKHAGFIFTNHTTYVDILTIFSTTPVRFVAKAEIRKWPVIGWLAEAIGCVFVQRDNKSSREKTRQRLALIEQRPPVVLFPEGKTAPYGRLLPFRRGAFEIAHQGQVPFLPAAIIYGDRRLFDWKTRPALVAWWEMLSRGTRLEVYVQVLDPVQPLETDDPAVLCEETRQAILEVLIAQGGYEIEDDSFPIVSEPLISG